MREINEAAKQREQNKNNEQKYELVPLPFKMNELEPVISEETVKWHYNVHSQGYVDKANDKGDDFNIGGAVLHNIWWSQLQPPQDDNQPNGAVKALIDETFGSFAKFKEQFKDAAMSIQGSGWVLLTAGGEIKTIQNHDYQPCVLVLDWWEHSYYLDYQAEKEQYFDQMWKIYNWSVVNGRLLSDEG